MATTAPPPISRRVVAVGTVVLGLTAAAMVVDNRRVRTGELLVQTDQPQIRIAIGKGGRPVVAPTGNRSFILLPGDYEIAIDGPRSDDLRAVPARVSVVRNQRSVVRVEANRP